MDYKTRKIVVDSSRQIVERRQREIRPSLGLVYRHQLNPAVEDGATAMDRILPTTQPWPPINHLRALWALNWSGSDRI